MPELRDVEQSVLLDVEAAAASSVRPKRPVDKTFRRYDQDQPMLLAPDVRDWLPADHPARWVDDLVEYGLDLAPFYDDYTEARGAPPYDPRLMLKLLIYGYSNGITSSRELERRCHHDVAFMFLTAQAAPDFVAISRFRRRHGKAFAALFTQVLSLCAQAGLVSLGRVALDGSKIRASASRHRAMSYDRMVRAEGEVAAEVEQLLAEAERTDAAEDAVHGDRRGDELPAGLARREGRLAAIRKAKADLEAEHAAKARAKAEQAAATRGADDAEVAAAGEQPAATCVVPGKAQRSFTDPDARIMKTSDGSFHYCYNAQTLVDEGGQVILSSTLVPSGADSPQLPGALTDLAESLAAAGIDDTPEVLLADAGYFSETNVEACTEAGIEALIATGRHKHGEKPAVAQRGRIPKGLTPKQRMTRKLRTKKGSAAYARRKAIVEPVFGQMKITQDAGRLRLRGLVNVQNEWTLQALCHNVRKLRNSGFHWIPAPALS
ncbi:MAG TPA: IS1182 family transposase [Candidatus Limnocylindria bacterium]|nr:IS1182 family transposase [Candidatus Limnocylindria bacterium]